MEHDLWGLCNAANPPWQPMVSLYHARGLNRIRAKKSLTGQRYLPGLDPGEDEHPFVAGGDGGEAAARAPVCPNCGGREFDEDGDCTSCWEPGVVRVAQTNARRARKTKA
jgi:hypothetical protein